MIEVPRSRHSDVICEPTDQLSEAAGACCQSLDTQKLDTFPFLLWPTGGLSTAQLWSSWKESPLTYSHVYCPNPDGFSFSFSILCCVFSEAALCPLRVMRVSKHKHSLTGRRAVCIPLPLKEWRMTAGSLCSCQPCPLPKPLLLLLRGSGSGSPILVCTKPSHGFDGFPAKQAVPSPDLVPKHIEITRPALMGLTFNTLSIHNKPGHSSGSSSCDLEGTRSL